MGATVMTNNQVIPITAGVRKAKRQPVAVRAETKSRGIELRIDLVPDSEVIWPQTSKPPQEENDPAESIHFKGCTEPEECDRSYWIASNNRVGVLVGGEASPADAVLSFASLEELTGLTSTWRMPQLVSVWNQLPGARRVTRFATRSLAPVSYTHLTLPTTPYV